MRTGSRADAGGAVEEVERAETKESFDTWADGIDSTGDPRASTVGVDQLRIESMPPKRDVRPPVGVDVPVAEWGGMTGETGADAAGVLVCTCRIGGCAGLLGYDGGGTSQCERKCSPRTELYGLMGLPRCNHKDQHKNFGIRGT